MTSDRAGALIEGISRGHKELISPEGVPLDVSIAGHSERLAAFCIDMFFMMAAIICSILLIVFVFFSGFSQSGFLVWMTALLFASFIVRNLYFIHFELAWQGRTPGKKLCGLRVVNRSGGELTASAIVARNLTREVEVFLPLTLLLNLEAEASLAQLTTLSWALVLTALPFFNREHLRAGDLIGGTQVIAIPKRALLKDLTEEPKGHTDQPLPQTAAGAPRYVFTYEQLMVYGNFELQVLEEILRRPKGKNPENERLLGEICEKIRCKIGWEEPVPPGGVRRFLNDFYAAERAELERGQLFGRVREDKNA